MQVVKRNGQREPVKLEKITKRIERLSKDLKNIDAIIIAQKVVQGLYDGVSSAELDKLAMETAYSMSVKHLEYDELSARLAISSLHKDTDSTFTAVVDKLMNVKDANGNPKKILSDEFCRFVKKNGHILDSAIDYNRDYNFDYFGFKTLAKSYLLKVDGKIVERPQHLFMRVSCGIWFDNVEEVLKTYEMLSKMNATHATPTLFNSGLVKNQLSSCFLMGIAEDSIAGIYDSLKEVALISQSAGGIGIHISNIRSKGSTIYGTGGVSNGLLPMLKVYDSSLRYVDQCLLPNELVLTENGYREIKNISIQEDNVKSLNGFSNLKDKKEFDVENVDINKITTDKGTLSLTAEHPILAVKNPNNLTNNEIMIRLEKGLMELEWIDVKDLEVGDKIVRTVEKE